jgi:hypothetical protein
MQPLAQLGTVDLNGDGWEADGGREATTTSRAEGS